MSNSVCTTIGDICSRFSSGKGISATEISAFGKYPVYGGNGLRGYTDTYNFDGECAIIGRQGAYCGNVRYFCGKAYMTEHAIVACTKPEHNTGYLAYKLSLMNLGQYQGQSAQPGLSVKTLSAVELTIPEKHIQDKIFATLKTLDDKIENNNRINDTLQQMAKTIYDYWFTQFDFPNEDGKPYKSSGGKMVWNEELKREIPKGWLIEKLDTKVLLRRTSITCEDIPSDGKYVGLEHIPRKKIVLDTYGTPEEIASNKLLAKDGDILFSKIRPYFHKVSVTPWDVYCSGDTFIINTIREVDYAYIVFLLFSDNFVRYASNGKQGSKMPRADWDLLKLYPVISPPDDVLEAYRNIVLPSLLMMKENIKENIELENLRDWLLPMLMNGQVTVER